MSYTKEQRTSKAYTNLVNYVKEHGTAQENGTVVWDKYPVCVQDKCYDSIIVEKDKVYAANEGDKRKEWRDISLINYRYVDKVVPWLKKIDEKAKAK